MYLPRRVTEASLTSAALLVLACLPSACSSSSDVNQAASGGSSSAGMSGTGMSGAGAPNGVAGTGAGGSASVAGSAGAASSDGGAAAGAATSSDGGAGNGAGGGTAGASPSAGAANGGSAGASAAGAGGGVQAGGGASASCGTGAFVCEGFESYPTGAPPNGMWTTTLRGSGSTKVDATHASSGSKALHVTGTPNGDVANIVTAVSIPAGTVFVRFMMYTVSYPSSSGIHTRLARIGTTADTGLADSAYSLSSFNGTAIEKINSIYLRDTTTKLNDDADKNRWVCIEYEIDETGGVGKVVPHIWVDSKALTLAVAGSATHGMTSTSWDPIPFQKFTLGLEGFQTDTVAADFWVDDLSIAPQRVGCPAK